RGTTPAEAGGEEEGNPPADDPPSEGERHHDPDEEPPDDIHGGWARGEAGAPDPLHDTGEPVAGAAAHAPAEGDEKEALRVRHRASSPARTASTRARAAVVLASSSATAASPSARWCRARCSARSDARRPS